MPENVNGEKEGIDRIVVLNLNAVLGDLHRELDARLNKEAELESIISDKDELRGKLEEAKQREENLETELASMWARVAKIRKSGPTGKDALSEAVLRLQSKMLGKEESRDNLDGSNSLEELKGRYRGESERCKALVHLISKLKVSG